MRVQVTMFTIRVEKIYIQRFLGCPLCVFDDWTASEIDIARQCCIHEKHKIFTQSHGVPAPERLFLGHGMAVPWWWTQFFLVASYRYLEI